ncbi:hypothetical protein HYU96_02330, partial [Candidatus Daviesbacteria bacterium]|nr:hypothetical protein [Candidatus Daviesbacteria bacterium]
MDNQESAPQKKWFGGPKIIFVILGAVLLIEIVYAVWVLNTPAPVPPPETVSLPKTVSLSLYSPRSEFKK